MGIRAYYSGYAVWVTSDDTSGLFDYVETELHQLVDASSNLDDHATTRL